jgi:hypothetical protein
MPGKKRSDIMKTRITVAMIMFIGFVLCSAAVAYYPVLMVRECPHCKAHVVQEETVSGNTIGAKHFTDGRTYAPMLPDHPWLAKCPVCGGLFWIDEATVVGYGFEAAKGDKQVLAPPEKEIQVFLTGHALPKDKEIYLRMRAWWAANDVWRWLPNPKPAFSKEQVKNLRALSALLDESEPDQRILKAEIARELGCFGECLLFLSFQFDRSYDHAVGFIKNLAEQKIRAVKPFEMAK